METQFLLCLLISIIIYSYEKEDLLVLKVVQIRRLFVQKGRHIVIFITLKHKNNEYRKCLTERNKNSYYFTLTYFLKIAETLSELKKSGCLVLETVGYKLQSTLMMHALQHTVICRYRTEIWLV